MTLLMLNSWLIPASSQQLADQDMTRGDWPKNPHKDEAREHHSLKDESYNNRQHTRLNNQDFSRLPV